MKIYFKILTKLSIKNTLHFFDQRFHELCLILPQYVAYIGFHDGESGLVEQIYQDASVILQGIRILLQPRLLGRTLPACVDYGNHLLTAHTRHGDLTSTIKRAAEQPPLGSHRHSGVGAELQSNPPSPTLFTFLKRARLHDFGCTAH